MVDLFDLEQVLVRVKCILLLEFLRVESVLHFQFWLALLVLLIVQVHGSLGLFERAQIDLQNLLYVRIRHVRNLFNPIQKFLGVRSYLSRISRSYINFYLLPVFSVLSECLHKALMFFVSPSALTQSTLLARREVRLLSTLIIHSLVGVIRCVFH